MYNIEQMKNHLESPVVTDQDLVNFVQNPGQVPSYLALAELQRRKEIRQSAPVNQGPQAPVAQQLIQEVKNADTSMYTPQGISGLQTAGANVTPSVPMQDPTMMADSGVANLPVDPGMFQEQSFAGGGIVAFDEGGHIPSYAGNGPDGSYVLPDAYDPEEYAKKRYYEAKRLKDMYEQTKTPLSLSSAFTGDLGRRVGDYMAFKDASKALDERANTPYDPAIMFYKNKLAEKPDDKYLSSAINTLGKQKEDWLNTSASSLAPPRAEPTENPNAGGYTYQTGETATKSPSDTYFDTLRDFMPKDSAASNIKADRLKYDPNLFGGPQNIEDAEAAFTKGTERYKNFMGDNTALADAEKRLLEKEAKLKGRESENQGYGLLAAAAELFDVRKGQEGAGISRAIKSGTGEYLKGRDKLEDTRDKIDSTKLELGQFRRAEQANTFKYGEEDRKTVDARNQANKKEDKLYNLKVQEKNIETGLKEKELGLQGQLVDIKRMDLAKDIAYGNRQLGLYEDRFRLSDEATKAKYLQVKSKAVIEANKYVQSNPPEVRSLVKEFTDKGKKTYGNPEFDGKLNLIKQGIVGNYLDQIGFGGGDSGPEVPSVSDLLNKKQPTQ